MGAAEERVGMSDLEFGMMEVDGQPLRYVVRAGGAARPPLLMFNGIGANLELGLPFLSALGETKAILFDVPGVGGSPLPKLPYRPRTLARWAKGLCAKLGHDVVDVSGVSWGGGMAQQFARQYPKGCRRLVLAATAPGWTMVPGKPDVLRKMGSIRRYTDRGYMRSIAAEIYGGDFRDDPSHIERHAAGMKPQSQQGYTYQLLCMAGWTSLPWLWSLRQPTLIMAGTDDPLVPVANAKLLNAMIPRSRLHLVENGHLFLVTRPEESAATVEAFLAAPDPLEAP